VPLILLGSAIQILAQQSFLSMVLSFIRQTVENRYDKKLTIQHYQPYTNQSNDNALSKTQFFLWLQGIPLTKPEEQAILPEYLDSMIEFPTTTI